MFASQLGAIRRGCKGLATTNTPAYFTKASTTKRKMLVTLAGSVKVIKLFSFY
jgi:hypothetical protein